MTGPLEGITVVEMANVISGPYAGMLLADLGAEVIKIELPDGGDPFRQWSERQGTVLPQFAAYNRGKKSVTLNVKLESGREIYRRLAASADVVLENFRPGTLERLGIGYETLRNDNPGLVYCAISGLGSSGPARDRPTYDAIAQAMSGLMSQFTDLGDPRAVGPAMSDQLTGVYAAYAILGGLVGRAARQGRGQKIDISMLSASLAFMAMPIADFLLAGELGGPYTRAHRSQSYAFVASDGLPFAVHLSSPVKFWRGLTEVVEQPELMEDPRFKAKAGRVENYDALHVILADVFRTRPRAEWLARLEAADVPAGAIYTVAEALADPQVRHLGMVQTFGQGPRAMKLVGFAAAYEQTPCQPGLAPPEIGEHNAEVLGRLDYGEEDLARLRTEGAI